MIFPIGHYIGAFHPGPDAPLAHHSVRIGAHAMRLLSDDELGVWALSHGVPDEAARPWTRDQVLAMAERAGIADVQQILDDLLYEEMLVEVMPDSPEAVGFAEDHRVAPLLAGSIKPATSEGARAIGVAGQPLIELNNIAFELWRLGHLADSLWDYTQLYGDALRNQAGLSAQETVPEQLLLRLLWELQPMLARGAVYLDAAVA